MKFKDIVRKLLFGLTIPQQYLCTGLGEFTSPSTTFIELPDGSSRQVNYILLGYKPVVIGIHDLTGVFKHSTITLDHRDASNNSVALLKLQLLGQQFSECPGLTLYEAIAGSHQFLNAFHQFTNKIKSLTLLNRPGNVDLPGNLYDMVRIAYSLPRTISLVSLQDGVYMNLFPTDLHGKINEHFYLSSLRIGGKAQQQVEQIGRIVICDVASNAFRHVYSLGKNHMQEMSPIDNFDLMEQRSQKFAFPLPAHTLRYRELIVLGHVDVGIHRLYLYTIESQVELAVGSALAHIHQYYAQWRINQGLQTTYLMR